MKKCFFLFILLLVPLPVFSANDMGVGIVLGNPTGLSGKYWLSEDRAVDGGLGMSIGKHTDVSVHSDYLLHKAGAFVLNDTQPLDLYYGIGARMEFADDIEIGVRVPVGLAYKVEDKSADVFAEVAPIFDLISKRGIELSLAFGARYYFK